MSLNRRKFLSIENNNLSNVNYFNKYFTIISLEDNNSIGLKYTGTNMLKTISVSTDNGVTWLEKTSSTDTNGTLLATLNTGDKLLIKGNNTNYGTSSSKYNWFISTNKFDVEGNIMSLLYGDLFVNYFSFESNYVFGYLFYKNKIVNAKNLILPATTLTEYCYCGMFNSCTLLESAPVLPAKRMSNSCYSRMFNNCTSLTKAPNLPATTLENSCYSEMFKFCTSLIIIPDLIAPTLRQSCYSGMFGNCTSLVNSCKILATTSANYCCSGMFSSCTSLKNAPDLSNLSLSPYIYNGMFMSCTSLTKAPNLKLVSSVPQSGYGGMFEGCTGLTEAPELPATSLSNYCYQSMFKGCTSLTSAPILPATKVYNSSYDGMFENCTSLTTAPTLPATTLASYCYYNMFSGCTSLINAPVTLPATTLATECYMLMFLNCTALQTAPELPATTLVDYCYCQMFWNCSSLNYIKCLATDISASSCTSNWTKNVSSSGAFIKDVNTTWESGINGIPLNWAIYNNGEAKLYINKLNVLIADNYPYVSATLYNPENLPVTYSSSNPSLISVNSSTGQITLNNYGTVTISIAFAGNDTYSAKTLTYTIEYYLEMPYVGQYLTFEAVQDTTFTFTTNALQYSLDGGFTWSTLAKNTSSQTIIAGNKIMWKQTGLTPSSSSGIGTFSATGNFKACGNIMSLLYGDDFIEKTYLTGKDYAFYKLFYNNAKLINAEHLILPATTLAYACYQSMFYGCTSLTTAPELPATTLKNYCYNSMFSNCTSLTTAPELPAPTLVTYCYYQMFYKCSLLNYVECLATDISASGCTYMWLSLVASSGTFYCKYGYDSIWSRGTNGVPTGWNLYSSFSIDEGGEGM